MKLLDFITKMNRLTEGNVKYYEINDHGYNINSLKISKDLTSLIATNNFLRKTLLFIDPSACDHMVNIPAYTNNNVRDACITPNKNLISSEIIDCDLLENSLTNTNTFLYPRLSQLNLVN